MPMSRIPPRSEGRLANRHGRWVRDAVDAEGAFDERRQRGRQSRVVLMPRRWHQVGGIIPLATEARKPGLRGERGISRKPLSGDAG
jgi:hypothetical protein